MPIRVSGLVSGMDTEGMITELVSAYSAKLTSYEKEKTKLEWTQEKWSGINKNVYSFYTGSLSSMRMKSSFLKKNVSVSDPTKASVTADASVATGTQTLEIKQLAKASYLTGAKVSTKLGEKVAAGTKLSELGVTAGSMKLTVAGEDKTIDITSDMTMSGFITALRDAGLSANFDSTQQRIFVGAAESGADYDFSFETTNEAGLNNLKNLGLATDKDIISLEAVMSLGDITSQADAAYEEKMASIVSSARTSGNISDLVLEKAYVTQYMADNEGATEEDAKVAYAALSDEDKSTFKTSMLSDENVEALTQAYKDTIGESVYKTVKEDLYKELYEAAYAEKEEELAESLTGYAVKQQGENAIIKLNGAEFEQTSNQFTVNGLSITATGVTDGAISISTATDTDGIYDMIVSFFDDYNKVINELTENYSADSAKGYEPLTSEEKDAMSDTEVKEWEEKIKKSLLRRDDTLSSIISAMNSAMQKGISVNGKTVNLSTYGIQTQSILSASANTQNAFHIDGNKKDSVSSDNKDKLKTAIASDPEGIAEFFSELSKNLYKTLTDKMKSTTLSSAYTIYNDKSMKSELAKVEENIEDWEDKVADYEEKWYKKFSAMETALSKLESQTSSLTALIGM